MNRLKGLVKRDKKTAAGPAKPDIQYERDYHKLTFNELTFNTLQLLNEFKALNIVVDVEFKFDICVVWPFIINVEFDEKLFKLLFNPLIFKYE